MEALGKSLIEYLVGVTGISVELTPMPSVALPFHLERQYAMYTLKLDFITLEAILLREPELFTPSRFQKQLKQLTKSGPQLTCIVATNLPGYVRKRLIEAQQAFVVPGVQMYLPMLGMELRTRAARAQPRATQGFSPATQAVLFYLLQGSGGKANSPLNMSKLLGYSAMSMSRAMRELETTEIVKVQRSGKERLMSLADTAKASWQKALPYLRNPISKVERVLLHDVKRKNMIFAGETALARLSLLSEPVTPCYAVGKSGWQSLVKAGIERIPVEEPDTCLLQTWLYDPSLLTTSNTVDPYSLYMSLQDDSDERIEQALALLMERIL